ncbi:MAG TPA: FG-GAP-like repeat-containing protein [Polyangiaceae bacterium]|jgi:hypothetical protein
MVACSGGITPNHEEVGSTSEALFGCNPACTSPWTQCTLHVANRLEYFACSACGGPGQAACGSSTTDPGCQKAVPAAFAAPSLTPWNGAVTSGSLVTLMGDVDGDHRADIVTVSENATGTTLGASVYTSTGSSFALEGSPWLSWTPTPNGVPPIHDDDVFLGDVDGDGRADLVVLFATSVGVFLSIGNQFGAHTTDGPQPWNGSGSGTWTPQYGTEGGMLLGDLSGDGLADLVFLDTNQVRVALAQANSNGTGYTFDSPRVWWTSPFYGSHGTFVGDVDGDHRADLVGLGDGYVGGLLSAGTTAGSYVTLWGSSFYGGYGSYLGDVNGDGRADLVGLGGGYVGVIESTGSSPPTFGAYQTWSYDTFDNAGGALSFLTDVDGDGSADLVGLQGTAPNVTAVVMPASPGSAPMGTVGGLCATCGDLDQKPCDTSWQSPGSQVPWANGCSPTSRLEYDTGQPLTLSTATDTCAPCGLPNQPACTCVPATSGCGVGAAIQVANAEIQLGTTPAQVAAIGPSFVGVSYDKATLNQQFFTGSNAKLIELFNQLGPGILKIGGGPSKGVDSVPFNQNGAGHVSYTTDIYTGQVSPYGEVALPDFEDLFAFLAKTPGWKLVYGLSMVPNCAPNSCSPTPTWPANFTDPNTGLQEASCINPTAAVLEAEGVVRAATLASNLDALAGFEIGNEPEVYAACGSGISGVQNYSAYQASWQAIAPQVASATPGVPLAGPATGSVSSLSTYTLPFAAQAEANGIGLLTQHYYDQYVAFGTICGGQTNGNWTTWLGSATANPKHPPAQTCSALMNALLTPDPALVGNGAFGKLNTASNQASPPIAGGYRFTEANTFSGGGVAGVSDTQASALWTLDFLFGSAQGGAAGVNLNNHDQGDYYQPIADVPVCCSGSPTCNKSTNPTPMCASVCDANDPSAPGCHLSSDPAGHLDPGVRPQYYAMLLFTLAGQGPMLQTSVSSALNVSAYTVAPADGSIRVVILNKDPTKTAQATVTVASTKPISTGTMTTLTAPSLTSSMGPFTLGGASIPSTSDSFAWAPAQPPAPGAPSTVTPTLGASGSTFTVSVPPASAALVHLAP